MKHTQGITLIELLIVIALVALLAAATTPIASQFLLRNSHTVAVSRVSSALRKAQSYSMIQKDGVSWGVCQLSGAIVIFSESCSSEQVLESYTPPSSLTISQFDPILFSAHRGETTATNISIRSSIDSAQITISEVGVLYAE